MTTTPKLSAEQKNAADETLNRLDKVAADITANHAQWGLDFDEAKSLVNHLDTVSDNLEKAVYGSDSLQNRQVEVLKNAKVLNRDQDEPYMTHFEIDMGVVQQDADEPYMSAYRDDQSSAVGTGTDSAGRKLAPTY